MEEINNNELEIRIAISSIEENIRKLHEATKKGCIESLKILIEEDPHLIQKAVTSSSNNNETHHPFLHLSVSNGHLEFARLLLHYEPQLAAEVDSFQRTPLHLASEHGDIKIVEALLERNMSACFVYDNNGFIPLHYAVMSGQMDIIKELIKTRPRSLWMKLKNGQTVLHLCVESKHFEGMKLLIETYVKHDEDFLNTTDDKGNTILDLSMALRQVEMVGYLLSIPEVKTKTDIIANIESSLCIKESLELVKISKTGNTKRQRRRFASKKTIGRWKAWKKNLKYKGDWFQEVQRTMMLVATVIATVTFQAGVNPPGGVWQQDTLYNSSSYFNNYYYYNNISFREKRPILRPAGTAVMNSGQSENLYRGYLWMNSISFLASISVILLVVGRFPLKNRICSWLLALAMCVAVVSLGTGYLYGVQMVNCAQFYTFTAFYLLYLTVISCLGVVRVTGVWHILSFWVWIVKTLLCTFISKLKILCFNRTTH